MIFLEVMVGQVYRHFKGNLYEALYGDNKIWVRDYLMFTSLVDKKKYPLSNQKYRFELVK